MIRKQLFFTVIFLFISFIVFGQDSTAFKSRHLFGVYSGYSRHIIKDDIISPLKYKGSTAPIGLMYSFQKHQSIQDLVMYFDKTNLKSSISNSRFFPFTNNLNAVIGYSYNRKIHSSSKINADFYLGGKFIWEFSYREHFYDSYVNELTGEQITSIGLNFIISKNWLHSEDNIYVEFNLPFLAYSAFNRRYNAVVGEATDDIDEEKNIYWQLIKNGNLNTINNFQEFQSTISYRKYISEKLGLLFRYHLHFYNLLQYKDISYARNLNYQFNIGLIYKIER